MKTKFISALIPFGSNPPKGASASILEGPGPCVPGLRTAAVPPKTPRNLLRGMFVSGAAARSGFSLVELLVVITVISIMLGLGASAFVEIARGQGMRRAVSEVSDLVELGRLEAMSTSTWTWIGFSSQTNSGETELLAVLMVSKDGSKDRSEANLRMAFRPLRIKNVKLLSGLTDWTSGSNGAYSGTVSLTSGNLSFSTAVKGETLTFSNSVLGFSPRGEALINESSVSPWIEIGLREMRGEVEIPEKTASVRVSGFSGQQTFDF